MVFTVRYILGILLVLISCAAIDSATIRSRSIRDATDTQVPKNESHFVATTTETFSTSAKIDDILFNNGTKTENKTTEPTPESTTLDAVLNTENVGFVKHLDAVTEASATAATLVSATTVESVGVATTNNSIEQSEIDNLVRNTTENSKLVSSETKQQVRTENGRSLDFDISKYTSPEFHNRNNVYNLPTSPENEKYVSSDFDHETTTLKPKPTEFPRFTHTSELTTPFSEYFDTRFHEVEHGVEQDLKDIDNFFENQTSKHDKPTSLNDIIEKAKRNDTESNLDFLRYTSVINDNKEEKNSVHKNYENEERLKINFDSIYNDTTVIDETILITSESPITLTTTEKPTKLDIIQEKIDKVNFITTTRRAPPTKFSLVNKTLDHNSLLSNKIETETLKPVERLKDISSKEVILDSSSNQLEKKTDIITTEKTERNDENNKNKANNKEIILEHKGFNRSPEENIISVSKRGSTKVVEHQDVPPKVSTNTNRSLSLEQNVEENNIYAVLVTTTAPATTTPQNLPETTETMYEMTDERFEATTDGIVGNTKKARELATTVKSDETQEVYYEMTTETTTMPSWTTEVDVRPVESATVSPQRFITEIPIPESTTYTELTSTTEGKLLSSTVPLDIMTGRNLDGTISSQIYNDFTEAYTTESYIESSTVEIESSTISPSPSLNFSTAALVDEENTTDTESSTIETINTSTLLEVDNENSTKSYTDVIDGGKNMSLVEKAENNGYTTETAENFTKDLENGNYSTEIIVNTSRSTSTGDKDGTETTTQAPSSTTIINTTESDFDDDDDDDYIDFSNRKVNASSGHEEIDVLNPDAPEELTTVGAVTTTMKEHTGDVTAASANTLPATTGTELTTETEDITETMTEGSSLGDPESSDGTVIAITISSIGAVCLVLLAILLFIMRRRQKKFNYGQRCTPVSLDSYSMDNVSVYNSVRRKTAIRDSKRSYGNPAFDDATVSQPLNFQALVKYANSFDEIATEFEAIPMVTARMSELPEGCEVKNRYANVIPLPETRVVLTPTDDDPTGDYINANFVTGPKGVRGYYIACQAPLSNTVNDFWRMIWEQQSRVILMLTHLFESGVEKCVDYLPPSEVLDCHRLFGDYQVTLKKREVKDKYIISSLQLKNMVTNSWREVTHFWYSGWPEKGVPSEENSIIAFLIVARSYVKLVQNSTDLKFQMKDSTNGGILSAEVSPVVVHCSPGTGRTGTVIACDIAIREFELKRLVDIPRIVYRIRRDRASSVQTKDQYTFIYRVINLYATKLTGGALDSI